MGNWTSQDSTIILLQNNEFHISSWMVSDIGRISVVILCSSQVPEPCTKLNSVKMVIRNFVMLLMYYFTIGACFQFNQNTVFWDKQVLIWVLEWWRRVHLYIITASLTYRFKIYWNEKWKRESTSGEKSQMKQKNT